jgi:hypothetical protein
VSDCLADAQSVFVEPGTRGRGTSRVIDAGWGGEGWLLEAAFSPVLGFFFRLGEWSRIKAALK